MLIGSKLYLIPPALRCSHLYLMTCAAYFAHNFMQACLLNHHVAMLLSAPMQIKINIANLFLALTANTGDVDG